MGVYLVARLVDQTPDELTYWACDGSDETNGETLVIPRDNPATAHTAGLDHLRRRSETMLGKILHTRNRTGEWPQVASLQA